MNPLPDDVDGVPEQSDLPYTIQRSKFIYRELDGVSFLRTADLDFVFADMPLFFVESIRRFIRNATSPESWNKQMIPVFFINDWLRKIRVVPDPRADAGFVGLSILIRDGIAGIERMMTISTSCDLLNVTPAFFSHTIRPLCPYYHLEELRKPLYRHIDLVHTVYRLGDLKPVKPAAVQRTRPA